MQKCDEAHRWPDSSDAVPDAELDEFVVHAETCPYHGELMRAEEDALLGALRLESSLAGGRVAAGVGGESDAWAEYAALYESWAASGKPVRSVVLRYRGQDVARHEQFDEVDVRVVRVLEPKVKLELETDQSCDLEIWKLPDDEADEEVFLGVYPLPGFRHTGKARDLRLPNGQTVMLSVRHVCMNKYEIEFACVDSEPAVRATQEPETEMLPRWWREKASGFDPSSAASGMPLSQMSTAFGLFVLTVFFLCIGLPAAALPPGYTSASRCPEPKRSSAFMATPVRPAQVVPRRMLQGRDVASSVAPLNMIPAARSPVSIVHNSGRRASRYTGEPPAPGSVTKVELLRTARSAGCESFEELIEETAEAPKPASEAETDASARGTSLPTDDARKADESTAPRDEEAAGVR